jgi:hypothetical protein
MEHDELGGSGGVGLVSSQEEARSDLNIDVHEMRDEHLQSTGDAEERVLIALTGEEPSSKMKLDDPVRGATRTVSVRTRKGDAPVDFSSK